VQAIMAKGFSAVRADADVAADVVLDLDPAGYLDQPEDAPERGTVARSTIDAAEYLARQGDLDHVRGDDPHQGPSHCVVRIADPTPSDPLDQAVALTRNRIADRSRTLSERIQTLWAAVYAARTLGAADIVAAAFIGLAENTGLVADLGRHGAEDVAHVVRWAMRGLDPFDRKAVR
jgi:hypothetical protein